MPPGLANCFVERGDLIAPRTLAQCFTGPYRVPNVRMTSTALLTNKTRPAPVARPAATRAHSFASGYNAERRLVGPERVPFARSPFGPDGCTSSLQHLFDRKCPQNPIADGAGHGPSPSTTGGTTVTPQVLSLLSDACAPAWFASGAFNDGPTITGVPSAIASATTDSARAFGVSEARFRLKSQARPAHLCPDWLAGLELPADRIVLAEAPPAVLISRIGVNSASPKTAADNGPRLCHPSARGQYWSAVCQLQCNGPADLASDPQCQGLCSGPDHLRLRAYSASGGWNRAFHRHDRADGIGGA